MHDLPRQELSELLAKHGHSICDDPKRLEGLLKDALRNDHKRETFVLVSALREGVAHELRGPTSGMPLAALGAKLVRQLCDNLALDEAAAQWGVESWAIAFGMEITPPPAAATKQGKKVNKTRATPVSGVGVDLVALALQHREKARQDQAKAAAADAISAQIAREAKANAGPVQKQARELAEQTRDFETAARMLKEVDPQWRDAKLYEKICGDRDRVAALDAGIQRAVKKGQLRFLRGRVQALLTLQPERDDMRRLLEVLPDQPQLAKEFTNSIGMKFVLIQSGEFMMGSNEEENEEPPHMVEITQPFYMGVFPVTQAEYQVVTGQNRSHAAGIARHPVESVCWNDAVAYAKKLSQLPAEMNGGLTYRLPTEAEWEYACRAGSTGKWCFGDDEPLLGEYAWFDRNSLSKTHPVGEKKPNAWGLYDMHGNVWEWCSDYYDDYPTAVRTDPRGPTTGSYRGCRGGGWSSSAGYCRSSCRGVFNPSNRYDFHGFRIALSPSDQ